MRGRDRADDSLDHPKRSHDLGCQIRSEQNPTLPRERSGMVIARTVLQVPRCRLFPRQIVSAFFTLWAMNFNCDSATWGSWSPACGSRVKTLLILLPPTSVSLPPASMSTKRRTLREFLRGNHRQTQPVPVVPSPPSSPVPHGLPDALPGEEAISTEQLYNSVESLEMLLQSMNNVRKQLNRYNMALHKHADALRQYAVNMNMLAVTDERGRNQGDDRLSEYLIVYSANYYDRFAEAQEQLVCHIGPLY
jgi:hypothetical protein